MVLVQDESLSPASGIGLLDHKHDDDVDDDELIRVALRIN
jgi:hypothetical protein